MWDRSMGAVVEKLRFRSRKSRMTFLTEIISSTTPNLQVP